ncbi:17617_t:CDS:2 [Acaulospora colombiana]|uniref:17617_t:CDS:1 n=1 Tax=Acaulospora colombiana TaxID=27376 RepID=A0ACA9KZI6_9GLOM|nr:17617_t:CDS:2 [Acaulospora colombiana]
MDLLDLNKVSSFDILSLLVASDELLLEELFQHVQSHLIKKESAWIKQNFVTILHTIFRLVSCKELKDYCLELICDNPKPLFDSENFPSLDKDIFLQLIKRDELNFEEVDIWEHLIKWGIYQTPGIEELTDKTKLSEKNFKELKKTVNPFIPYIRFYEISSKDFFNKVRPFRNVLPSILFEDVMSFLMAKTEPTQESLPSRMGSIIDNSKIITRKHANIISNWIEKKDTFATINKRYRYYFTLLYRGTRDGFNANSFHQKVNGRGQAIAVIKVKESEEIIGGFNANGWSGNGSYNQYNTYNWINNYDNFIFSFGSQKNYRIGRFNGSYGIYDQAGTMINFGNSDLLLNTGQNGSCSQSSYDKCILDTRSFFAEELEVFSVVKKNR